METVAEGRPSENDPADFQTASSFETGQWQTASRPARYAQRPSEGDAANEGRSLLARLTGGNLLLKTGIVVLFLGLAFLLRYASERVHIPIGLRYLSVAGGGLEAAKPAARIRPDSAGFRRGGDVSDLAGGFEAAPPAARASSVCCDGGAGGGDGRDGGAAGCPNNGSGRGHRRDGRTDFGVRRQRQLSGAVLLSRAAQYGYRGDCPV